MGEATSYAYDASGNLVSKIDAKNQKTGYVYDDAGRLEQIKYDDNYRKVSETVNYGTFSLTNTYTYNKNGTKKTFTGPDNITYGYLYDANNQLTGVQIPNVGFITISEYTWNRPKSMTLPGGSTRQFTYDPLMRTKQITAKDPGQNTLMNYQYTYDKMDNITTKTTEHGDYDYEYDDLYRLMSADPATGGNEAFTYDAVGNRLTAAYTTGNWTYNQNNELGGYDDVSYVYDANGNMTQKTAGGVVTKFFYNTEDRLTQVWNGAVGTGSLISSYYYDPFGRRLWKEVGGTRTYFHYADEGLIGEYDSAGNEIKSYAYKPGSTWTTDPLFMKIGSDYYFYQNDHLGTPQKLTAINGAVVWAAKYSSFGEATVYGSSTITNNLRFPGQYFDQETGLLYNYFRYYDPSTGRYLATDPIGFAGGINLFVYVENNSISNTDPEGLQTLPFPTPVPFPFGHPVFIPGTPENQRIGEDLKRLFTPVRPIPDFKGNKQKLKRHSQPPKLIDGGPCKEVEPPGKDQCKEMEKFIWSDKFEKLPLSARWLYRLMYFAACHSLRG